MPPDVNNNTWLTVMLSIMVVLVVTMLLVDESVICQTTFLFRCIIELYRKQLYVKSATGFTDYCTQKHTHTHTRTQRERESEKDTHKPIERGERETHAQTHIYIHIRTHVRGGGTYTYI